MIEVNEAVIRYRETRKRAITGGVLMATSPIWFYVLTLVFSLLTANAGYGLYALVGALLATACINVFLLIVTISSWSKARTIRINELDGKKP